ncbi:MAG: adenylate/guanylate cyclase domain-containing protein, partial [Actinomycetota bacterium]|nr:adenylate/guanylate cyclase domain-containing protein [Actinomycetota bacterium]
MPDGESPGSLDLEEAGLLDGCDTEGRAERAQLVEFLRERGVGVAEMRQAIAEDRLPMLASERALAGDLNYSARDVADLAGVPLDVLLEVRHAMGLVRPQPDERMLGEGDLQWARIVGRLLAAGLPYEQLLDTLRVLGRGLAYGARSIRETLASAILDAGLSERRLALATVQATEQLLPLAGPLLQETLRAHLLEQVQREQNTMRELRASRRLPGSREIVVCFADLVDFTMLGEQLPIDELQRIASKLERLTVDLVEAPVQLVKTVGDAVMLVSPDAT